MSYCPVTIRLTLIVQTIHLLQIFLISNTFAITKHKPPNIRPFLWCYAHSFKYPQPEVKVCLSPMSGCNESSVS